MQSLPKQRSRVFAVAAGAIAALAQLGALATLHDATEPVAAEVVFESQCEAQPPMAGIRFAGPEVSL